MTIRSQRQGGRGRKGDEQRERGAVLVEFSLVVVLFIALLYGLIAYGMAFALKQSMTDAVSEAARSAVGAPAGGEVDTAYATADDRLGWLGEDRCCEHTTDAAPIDKHMELTVTTIPNCRGSDTCLKVEAKYDYGSSPLIPTLRLPGFSAIFPDEINSRATAQLPPPDPSAP